MKRHDFIFLNKLIAAINQHISNHIPDFTERDAAKSDSKKFIQEIINKLEQYRATVAPTLPCIIRPSGESKNPFSELKLLEIEQTSVFQRNVLSEFEKMLDEVKGIIFPKGVGFFQKAKSSAASMASSSKLPELKKMLSGIVDTSSETVAALKKQRDETLEIETLELMRGLSNFFTSQGEVISSVEIMFRGIYDIFKNLNSGESVMMGIQMFQNDRDSNLISVLNNLDLNDSLVKRWTYLVLTKDIIASALVEKTENAQTISNLFSKDDRTDSPKNILLEFNISQNSVIELLVNRRQSGIKDIGLELLAKTLLCSVQDVTAGYKPGEAVAVRYTGSKFIEDERAKPTVQTTASAAATPNNLAPGLMK